MSTVSAILSKEHIGVSQWAQSFFQNWISIFVPFRFHEIFSWHTFEVQTSVYVSGGLVCLHAGGTSKQKRAANHEMPKTYCSSHLPAKDWKFWNYLVKRLKVKAVQNSFKQNCRIIIAQTSSGHYRYWYRSCLCHFFVPPIQIIRCKQDRYQ